jgi:hypothetical protein
MKREGVRVNLKMGEKCDNNTVKINKIIKSTLKKPHFMSIQPTKQPDF